MVSFTCDGCQDVVKKPKLKQHSMSCRHFYSFTCIDCTKTFFREAEWVPHTTCYTEQERYSAGFSRNKQEQKGNGRGNSGANEKRKRQEDNSKEEQAKKHKTEKTDQNSTAIRKHGSEKQEKITEEPNKDERKVAAKKANNIVENNKKSVEDNFLVNNEGKKKSKKKQEKNNHGVTNENQNESNLSSNKAESTKTTKATKLDKYPLGKKCKVGKDGGEFFARRTYNKISSLIVKQEGEGLEKDELKKQVVDRMLVAIKPLLEKEFENNVDQISGISVKGSEV